MNDGASHPLARHNHGVQTPLAFILKESYGEQDYFNKFDLPQLDSVQKPLGI